MKIPGSKIIKVVSPEMSLPKDSMIHMDVEKTCSEVGQCEGDAIGQGQNLGCCSAVELGTLVNC